MIARFPYRSLLVPIFLLLAVFVQAQARPDTARYKVSDIDSLAGDVPVVDSVEETYEDTEVKVPPSVYFQAKIYQSSKGGPDSVRFRKLPDTSLSKLKSENDFWYVDYEFDKKKKEERDTQERSGHTPLIERESFQTFLWLLIVCCFVAVLAVYLGNSNVRLFRRSSASIRNDGEGETALENIFEINYQQEIDRAVRDRNYRLATRLLFLRLLKNLSDKNIIRYQQGLTNFDYLAQLHPTRYYPDFARLTRYYEYTWYGQFEVDQERFPVIRNDFDNFDRQLK